MCICVLQEGVDEGDRKRGTTQGVVLCHSDISLCVYVCCRSVLMKEIESEEQHRVWFCVILT